MATEGMTPETRMRGARANLIMKNPFFGILAQMLNLVEVPGNHPFFKTMATDNKNIYYNPLFVSLMDDEDLEFIVSHEILHIVLESMYRRGSRDQQLWNFATDYVINGILVESGLRMPTNDKLQKALGKMDEESKKLLGIDEAALAKEMAALPKSERVVGLYDKQYLEKSAEEVYELLLKQCQGSGKGKKKKGQGGKGQQGQQGQGGGDPGDEEGNGQGDGTEGMGTLDQHLTEESLQKLAEQAENGQFDDRTGSGMSGMTKEEMEILKQHMKQNVNQAKLMAAGKIPAGLRRMIEEISDPVINWRDHLSCSMTAQMKADFRWTPPNKKLFSHGITVPSQFQDEMLRVTMIIDTSGSIGEDDIRNVMSEVVGICSQYGGWTIQLLCFDHDVYNPKVYSSDNSDDIMDYAQHIRGGGGTCFEFPLRYVSGERAVDNELNEFIPDQVIFFTDGLGEGWCEWFQDHCREMIWIMSTSVVAPWGTTIPYDKYQ